MSDIDPEARREVNNAIANSSSTEVGDLMKNADSSIEKRRKNKEEREQREAEEKAAADAAVRAQPPTPQEAEAPQTYYVLTVINNRRAVPPARHELPESLRAGPRGRLPEDSLYCRAHNFSSYQSLLSLPSRIFTLQIGGLLGGKGVALVTPCSFQCGLLLSSVFFSWKRYASSPSGL